MSAHPATWPIVIAAGLGIAAGAMAIALKVTIVQLVLTQLLQPNSSTVILPVGDPVLAALLPLRLFFLSGASVAACVMTAWLVTRSPRDGAMAFIALLAVSILVTSIAAVMYRSQMQERIEVSANGQKLSMTRGQMLLPSDVPLVKLALLGPFVTCAAALALRRKKLRSI